MAKRYYSDPGALEIPVGQPHVIMYGDHELVRIYKERLEQTEAKLSELTGGAKTPKSVLDSQIAETDKDIALNDHDEKVYKAMARREFLSLVGITILGFAYVASIVMFASPWLIPAVLPVVGFAYYGIGDNWMTSHHRIDACTRKSIELWHTRSQLVQRLVDA